jgi:predicted Zn-dependent peptidase
MTSTPHVHHTRLNTGLSVVTIETPHLHSAFVSVHVRVGSRHETAQTNGVSHFLEHLFFRGSTGWPDSRRMNAAIEAVGGNLNAVTMRDSSSYYTPTHPEGVQVALEVLGDLLTRPLLHQVSTERRVILEEMLDEVDDRGRDIDADNLMKQLLYGSHPLGFKIAGTRDSVSGLTKAQVRRHFERFYVGGNLVVAVSGPVKHATVLRAARQSFARLAPGPRAKESTPLLQSSRMRFVPLDEPQVEFRLCFPTVPDAHPDATALVMLRRVLDDGLSSRLPYRVVEKRGLAYSIGAGTDALHDVGTFDIDGAAASENVAKVVAETLRTLATLRGGDISASELTRAKQRFRMHLGFLADSPADLCGWFGGLRLFREPESLLMKTQEAERISRADLKRVARSYLTAEHLRVVAVGPGSARAPLRRVLSRATRLLR